MSLHITHCTFKCKCCFWGHKNTLAPIYYSKHSTSADTQFHHVFRTLLDIGYLKHFFFFLRHRKICTILQWSTEVVCLWSYLSDKTCSHSMPCWIHLSMCCSICLIMSSWLSMDAIKIPSLLFLLTLIDKGILGERYLIWIKGFYIGMLFKCSPCVWGNVIFGDIWMKISLN